MAFALRQPQLDKQDIMQTLKEKRKQDFWGLTDKDRVSVMKLIDHAICIYDFKTITIRGEQKVVVKFSFEETDKDFHTFISGSEVIMDRLERDKADLPFAATIRQKKKYLCYE